MTFYAGIGSRKTPSDILNIFKDLGTKLAKKGFILRSGGASGADSAFESGCDNASGLKEIYLPWKGFNDNESTLIGVSEKAFEISSRFHPRWEYLVRSHKLLHGRNAHQVLGQNCDSPVEFVLCWTPLDSGGTLQALRIATFYKIEIFNFYEKNTLEKFNEYLYWRDMFT